MYLLWPHWNPKDKNKGGEFHYSHLTDEAQLLVKFTFTHPEVKETDPKAQALPTPHPI